MKDSINNKRKYNKEQSKRVEYEQLEQKHKIV